MKSSPPAPKATSACWPGHAPFLTTLGSGEVCYRTGRDEKCLAVSGGFAEVTGERVIILAESAELPEEIDRARAERAKQRAEARLSGKSPHGTPEDIDYARAVAALARAFARLATAGRLAER